MTRPHRRPLPGLMRGEAHAAAKTREPSRAPAALHAPELALVVDEVPLASVSKGGLVDGEELADGGGVGHLAAPSSLIAS